MTKLILKIAISINITFVTSPHSVAQNQIPDLVKRIAPSTVLVSTYNSEGKALSQGSGFFFGRWNEIITNQHVLEGAASASIKTSDGRQFHVIRVVGLNKPSDLVLLMLGSDSSIARPLAITKILPKVGETVVVIGAPLGLETTVTSGLISGIREMPEYGLTIQISASISSGSSGSPVVNVKGEVVGIATFVFSRGQNLNFAVSSKNLLDLERFSTPLSLKEWNGVRLHERAEVAAELYSQACEFFSENKYEDALNILRRCLILDHSLQAAHLVAGHCNYELGRLTEAIEDYRQVLRLDSTDAHAHYRIGMIHHDLGRHLWAIQSYERAIKYDPADFYNYLGLIYTMEKLERHAEVVDLCKAAIQLKPDHDGVQFSLGMAYLGLNNKKAARVQYEILRSMSSGLAGTLEYFMGNLR